MASATTLPSFRPLPAFAGEHIVHPGEGEQPRLERGFCRRRLHRVEAAQGLHGDGLDGRERVLHTVVEFRG